MNIIYVQMVTKFLKGYHHKERVLKSFEGKIKGETIYMPNLIFYRKNESGKILDELDQIYLINLKKNSKNKIHGFDMFYYKSYSNSKRNSEERFIQKGTPFEIINNNLYIIEIKK